MPGLEAEFGYSSSARPLRSRQMGEAIRRTFARQRIRAAERTAADSGRNDLTVVHDVPLLAEGGRANGYHLVIVETCRPSFSSSDWPASAA